MELMSIIVPCYNEQETLEDYYQAIIPIRDILLEQSCALEVLLVDDGSLDDTLSIMKSLSAANSWIRYISLTRNFGKEGAMYAGLRHAIGDYVAIMDVDLQDPPELIPQMLQILRTEDYDCVGSRRVNRKGEPIIRSLFARLFYKLMRRISEVNIVDGARDFRLMTRRYVNSLLELTEYNRFSKGLFEWVGYRTKWLEYQNVERRKGETKWSFFKLVRYSIDGIVDFSTMPVRFAAWVGLMFCMLAFVFILVIIARTLMFGDPVAGWPSLVCIILLLSGIQLFCLGVIGEYLSKTYLEVKKRPIYLCKETNAGEPLPDMTEGGLGEEDNSEEGSEKKSRGKKKKDKKAQGKKKKHKNAELFSEDGEAAVFKEINLEQYGWKDDETEGAQADEVWEEDAWSDKPAEDSQADESEQEEEWSEDEQPDDDFGEDNDADEFEEMKRRFDR